jgi:hypothetical protein
MAKKGRKASKHTEIQERLIEDAGDDQLLFFTDHDDCIIGLMERKGMEPVVCYDYDKLISRYMADGMSYDDAVEWYCSTIDAWMGDKTPCVLRVMLPGRDDGVLPVNFEESQPASGGFPKGTIVEVIGG